MKNWSAYSPLIPPSQAWGLQRSVDVREVVNGLDVHPGTGLHNVRQVPHGPAATQTRCWSMFDLVGL